MNESILAGRYMTPEFLTALNASAFPSDAGGPRAETGAEDGHEAGATFEALLAALTGADAEAAVGPAEKPVGIESETPTTVEVEGEIAGHPIPDWLRAALDAVEQPSQDQRQTANSDAAPPAASELVQVDEPGSAPTASIGETPDTNPGRDRSERDIRAELQGSAASASNPVQTGRATASAPEPDAGQVVAAQSAIVRPGGSGLSRDETSREAGIGAATSDIRRTAADSDGAPAASPLPGEPSGRPVPASMPGQINLRSEGSAASDLAGAGTEPSGPGSPAPNASPAAATAPMPAAPNLAPDMTPTLEPTANVDAMPELDAAMSARDEARAESRAGTTELRPVPLPELKGGIVQRLQELAAKAEADGVSLRNGSGDLSTELELAPAELGKLKLTLATTERGLHLVVHVDRPESVEAVRRQLEGLHRALLSEGLALDGFDISGGQDRREASLARDHAANGETGEAADALPDATEPAIARPAVPRGRLDIRI
ncbi:flagellar hook-length control protein FliK [uncultured Jannaschia sp.]|uniref:flagellar hook-length control protein FliK n=1 Tax=uncultured Jannaschia sp. TaxID=293347 RepID=UPI00261F91F0|nr:flagellar hook-length control protein FliK [uncultured Jannaschia sp.]